MAIFNLQDSHKRRCYVAYLFVVCWAMGSHCCTILRERTWLVLEEEEDPSVSYTNGDMFQIFIHLGRPNDAAIWSRDSSCTFFKVLKCEKHERWIETFPGTLDIYQAAHAGFWPRVKTRWRHVSCSISQCWQTVTISSRDIKPKAFNDSVKCFSPFAEVSSTSCDLLTSFILFLFNEFMEVTAGWAQQFLWICPKLVVHSFCHIHKCLFYYSLCLWVLKCLSYSTIEDYESFSICFYMWFYEPIVFPCLSLWKHLGCIRHDDDLLNLLLSETKSSFIFQLLKFYSKFLPWGSH